MNVQRNKLTIQLYFTLAMVCLISCKERSTDSEKTETKIEENEEIVYTKKAIVTKKVYRPEWISDQKCLNKDGSVYYVSQKHFPEEWELYTTDESGKVDEAKVCLSQFMRLKLKETVYYNISKEENERLSYDTIINCKCIVLEKFYFPEKIEIDTHYVKLKGGYTRPEITETLYQEKSYVRGIRLDNKQVVEVTVPSVERITSLHMMDTLEFIDLQKRHKWSVPLF